MNLIVIVCYKIIYCYVNVGSCFSFATSKVMFFLPVEPLDGQIQTSV